MTRYPVALYRDQYSAILENSQHIIFLDTTEVPKTIQCGNVLTLIQMVDFYEEVPTGYYFHVDIISVFDNMRIYTPQLRDKHYYIASIKLKTGKMIKLPDYDLHSWEKTTGIKYIRPVLKEIK